MRNEKFYPRVTHCSQIRAPSAINISSSRQNNCLIWRFIDLSASLFFFPLTKERDITKLALFFEVLSASKWNLDDWIAKAMSSWQPICFPSMLESKSEVFFFLVHTSSYIWADPHTQHHKGGLERTQQLKNLTLKNCYNVSIRENRKMFELRKSVKVFLLLSSYYNNYFGCGKACPNLACSMSILLFLLSLSWWKRTTNSDSLRRHEETALRFFSLKSQVQQNSILSFSSYYFPQQTEKADNNSDNLMTWMFSFGSTNLKGAKNSFWSPKPTCKSHSRDWHWLDFRQILPKEGCLSSTTQCVLDLGKEEKSKKIFKIQYFEWH